MFDPAFDFLTQMDWWSVQGVTWCLGPATPQDSSLMTDREMDGCPFEHF